ncbi:cation:proton antiporter [Thermodesulfobacterium hveragerdense]|uniref:cation:proton antiporter n=1 Tax=Thermodesulfobacterium hveragerdense TaxID=53424 RepID=UPI0004225ED3|nr:cation:proton antiporter [Thermodesulfobacterium hveragerdense]
MENLEIHVLFLYIGIILFLARLTGDIFAKFGIPSVIGEILVGVLLGQSVLGLIPVNKVIQILAELGIIFLLFHIGFEADLKQLKKVGFWALEVALIGAVFPFLLGMSVSLFVFDLNLTQALFIGGTLTATSIGITIRVLEDLGKLNERFSQIVLGAAVLDDIFGVVVLSILFEFSKTQTVEIKNTLLFMTYIATFFLIAPVLGKFLAHIISFIANRLSTVDFVPSVVVALMLFFAYAAHEIGSPEILGAFTAGIAFSRRFTIPFAITLNTDKEIVNKIETSLQPLLDLFTPIFFVYVGLQLNLKVIDFSSATFWFLSLILSVVAILGKLAVGLMIKGDLKERLSVGFSMVPRGEVGLIFAEFGRISGVYDEMLYAVMVFVVCITTFLPPVVLKIIWRQPNFSKS